MKMYVAAGVALVAITVSGGVAANTVAPAPTAKPKPDAAKVIAAVERDAPTATAPTPEKAPAAAQPVSSKTSVQPAVQGAALSPKAPKRKPKRRAPSLVASVNLSTQRMTVKEYGKVKHVWKVSTGRSGYRTPTGTYTPKWMTKMHYSKQYDNAPMPHSVFFHRGYAVHATYQTRRLGAPASHGCVRLSPANARTFYRLVSKHKRARTRISLHGVARDRKPTYAKQKKSRKIARQKARQRKARQRRVRRSRAGPNVGWNAKPQYSYSYPPQRTFPGDRPRRRIKPRYR